MFKTRRYVKPKVKKSESALKHVLDEATLLVEALVLQQTGTNLDKYKNLDIKKASIDSLNDVLYTMKSFIKSNLHFLDDTIDEIREFSINKIKFNDDFAKTISHILNLNLISDNNDIALYLAPYIESWDLLTADVQAIVLNHVIRSINYDIERARISEKITKSFIKE